MPAGLTGGSGSSSEGQFWTPWLVFDGRLTWEASVATAFSDVVFWHAPPSTPHFNAKEMAAACLLDASLGHPSTKR